MSNDYILSVIQGYADKCLREPQRWLPREYFEQRSYQKWAVNEILKSIKDSEVIPPVMVVENFIRKMDDFSCKNQKTSIIFSTAHDIAEDILDVLLAVR